MANIDVAFESIKDGWGLVEKNYADLFKKILAINLLAIVVFIAGLLIVVLLGLGIYMLLGPVGLIVALLAAVPLLFLASTAMTAVESVAYNVISKWPAAVGINENFNKNLKPVFFYSLAMAAIGIVAIIIEFVITFGVALALYAAINEAAASTLTDLVDNAVSTTMNVIIGFLFQFALFELVITRMGAVESLKKSADIAIRNFVPTIVFNIVVGLLAVFITLILAIPLVILLILSGAVLYANVMEEIFDISAGIFAIESLAIIGVAILIVLAVLTVIGAAVETVTLPMEYAYWKKVRGNEAEKKARAAPAKR